MFSALAIPVVIRFRFLLPQLAVRARAAAIATALAGAPIIALAYPDGQALDEGQTSAASASEAPDPVQVELTPDILYQLLLAEIAGGRGDIQVALGNYVELARSTHDPRIVRRAAELALYARQRPLALEMSELWVSIEPESPRARQTLIGLLLAAHRLEDAVPQLAKVLALEGDHIADGLMRLNRLFARYPDKQAVAQVVGQLTAPYLSHPEAYFARAQAAAAAGDEARALAEIERVESMRPEWQQAALLKAQMQQRKSAAAAQETLREFLARYPTARDVRIAYARMLVADKQYEPARAQFRIVLESSRDDPEAIYAVALLSLQVGDLPLAEEQFKRLLEVGFNDPNTVRFYLGQLAEEGRRGAEAVRWYEQVSSGEQYVPAKVRAAKLTAADGRLDDALALLRRAADSSPRDRITLLVGESQLLAEAGRLEQAFELLDRQLAASPEQEELLYETALLAEKLGRYEVLERNLRKLIGIRPEHAHAYNALGYSLVERNERLDEAQQLIDKALSLAPEDAFILDSKGWLLYRRGDAAGALDYLSRAYRQRADPEIAAHLGEVLWMLGRRDEAGQTWKAAFHANPGNGALEATMKKFGQQ